MDEVAHLQQNSTEQKWFQIARSAGGLPLHGMERPQTGHAEANCKVNGVTVSEGNLADMDWTFAEIIERCSYGVDVYAGDVIGSGTVGTGCFLELNGTGKLNDPDYKEQWLQNGDSVVDGNRWPGGIRKYYRGGKFGYEFVEIKKSVER